MPVNPNLFEDDGPPDFVNEAGIKWWLDERLTDYARKPNTKGVKLAVQSYRTSTLRTARTEK